MSRSSLSTPSIETNSGCTDLGYLLDDVSSVASDLQRRMRKAADIVSRAPARSINGACNVPGYRTSVDIRFYDDDFRELVELLGTRR